MPTPSWLVYFVLKAQRFFINFGSGAFGDMLLLPNVAAPIFHFSVSAKKKEIINATSFQY
jgi:hypothetical protein